MKFIVEKEYYDNIHRTWVSYESGNYDNKEFSTHEDAYKYAIDNLYRIAKDESFSVWGVEEDMCEFMGQITHGLYDKED